MAKKDYKKIHSDYISSVNWLLKKNELIKIYQENGWNIDCSLCGSTKKLQVHHTRYKNFGNEILTDENIWDLIFLCDSCHQRTHFENRYFDTMMFKKVGF